MPVVGVVLAHAGERAGGTDGVTRACSGVRARVCESARTHQRVSTLTPRVWRHGYGACDFVIKALARLGVGVVGDANGSGRSHNVRAVKIRRN